MNRRRTVLRIGLATAAVVALAVLAAAALLTDARLARRAEQALNDRLGVPVHIGRLHWQLLPVPMVEVFDATTEQEHPIVLKHLTIWPRLGPLLLHRELSLQRVLLDGASIYQVSLKQFKSADSSATKGDGPVHAASLPVERVEFHNVVWIGRREIPLEFDGTADFDAEWRPREAALWRTGVTPPARLDLHRIDGQDRWKADIAIADGSWNGTLALQQPVPESYRITGELEPSRVEVAQLLEAFRRKPVITGRASGRTTLEAEGKSLGEIVQSLHTRTSFSIAPATILHFDLDRLIRTIGKEHAGTTPLDTLTGVLDTKNDPDGIVMRYSDIAAKSGALSAHGTVVLQDRRVNADVSVDLVNGVVGVPLKITGPVSSPTYSVPAGALAGAAAGTAVLPGVGTVIGARIGDALGRIFGGSKKPTGKPASAQ